MNTAWEQRVDKPLENSLTPRETMAMMGDLARRFGHVRFCDMMTEVNNALGCESAISRMIRKQATHDRAIELQVRHQMMAIDKAKKAKEAKA